MEHPLSKMSELERLEMELEWDAVVEEMELEQKLGDAGFAFSHKMFKEAYSRGYVKLRDCKKFTLS